MFLAMTNGHPCFRQDSSNKIDAATRLNINVSYEIKTVYKEFWNLYRDRARGIFCEKINSYHKEFRHKFLIGKTKIFKKRKVLYKQIFSLNKKYW